LASLLRSGGSTERGLRLLLLLLSLGSNPKIRWDPLSGSHALLHALLYVW
jgi:hypothetical protein